jgi:hypothetical protein
MELEVNALRCISGIELTQLEAKLGHHCCSSPAKQTTSEKPPASKQEEFSEDHGHRDWTWTIEACRRHHQEATHGEHDKSASCHATRHHTLTFWVCLRACTIDFLNGSSEVSPIQR